MTPFVSFVCVTVEFSLYQVHPGADLVVKRLDVLQQVQLTLGHRRWTRFRCVRLGVRVLPAVCVCVLFRFYGGAAVCVCVRHSVSVVVCRSVGHRLVDVFEFYFLQKHTDLQY